MAKANGLKPTDTPRLTNCTVAKAYEAFAAIYNDFNHLNDYEMWLGRTLLPELELHGLRRGRVLDVGCGTGRSFSPLLKRGWEVFGCDISPEMLTIATQEGEGRVPLICTDMRELSVLGAFDLIISLNDPINYLLEESDLARAFRAIAANLSPHGLLLFDCTSKMTFETLFSGGVRTIQHQGSRWTWRGEGEIEPYLYAHTIDGDDLARPLELYERLRPEPEVRAALAAADLECLRVMGMDEVGGEVHLIEPPDEDHHMKLIYIAGRRNR
jgi:SAM-dependent methyltransferase